MTPKKGTHIPDDWRERFLAALCDVPNVSAACKKARVSRNFVYEQRDQDEVFAAMWDEALDEGIEHLEAEVHRRAFKGTPEPVFGRVARDKDGKIGMVRKYSDTLAMFLLKAHRPEKYKDRVEQKITGALAIKGYVGVSPDDWDDDDSSSTTDNPAPQQ